MPSFDVVSEVDLHEVSNAVDQAGREVANRFDFKGARAEFQQDGNSVTLISESEFQLEQMMDILYGKLTKRGIDIACVELGKLEQAGKEARRKATLRQGIDSELARKIVKLVKDAKLKVQAAIQGDKVRITGKKRDDLQSVIALLRQAEIELPLQYINFRD
ncbi:MAG: YajQ family cyclic di-GMP-binding protein [Aquisalimonadaceae bacterium]